MTSTAKKLASGSALQVVNFSAQVLVALFLTPLIIHSLGDWMYGFWTLVGTFIGYYGLLDFGLSNAVSRYVAGAIGAGDTDELNRVSNTAFFLLFIAGAVALLITVLIACLTPWIMGSSENSTVFWIVLLILGINVAIDLPIRTFVGVLIANLRFEVVAIIQLGSLVIRSILIFVVLSAGYKVVALALVTLIVNIPMNATFIYFARKCCPTLAIGQRYRSRKTAKTLLSYGLFTFVARIAEQLRFHTDAFIIAAFLGLDAVTHYRVASLMAFHFTNLLGAIMGVFTPLFSQQSGARKHDSIIRTVLLATKISICISSFIGFCLIALGKPFIQRWVGSEYLDAYPVLVILTIGLAFAMWQLPAVSFMYGTSKHKFLAVANTLEGIFKVILSIIFVNEFGIVGVAYASFIAITISKLVLQPIYFCQLSSIPYWLYVSVILKSVMHVCVSLVVPGIISITFGKPNFVNLLIIGTSSFCLYVASIWLIEFTSDEKKILLRSVIPRMTILKTVAEK